MAPTPVSPEADVVALLPYRDPAVHALIVEAKYHGNAHATDILGKVLADYLLEQMADATALEQSKIALLPLPLSGKRKRERGYNQSQAICTAAQKILGPAATTVTEVLERTRHTRAQARLGKSARHENIRGAFSTRRDPDPAYLYIVVDDVYTTGATLSEAMRSLKEAGATRVMGVALAH